MNELIKSILVFQKVASNSTAPFCTLSIGINLRKLPCHNRDDIPCTYCIFAAGQNTASTIKSM